MAEEITLAALAKAARNDNAQLDIQNAAETATLTFTAEERQKIDEIKSELDLRESVTAVEFGIGCQRRLAEFADTVLDNSTKDDIDVAGQLQALLGEIKLLDAGSAFKDTFWAKIPVIGSRARRMKKLKKGFSKARVRIEFLEQQLERSRMELLRGSERFDMLGTESAKCFRELTLYIQAGTEQLAQMRENVVPKLKTEAQRQNDPMAQQLIFGFEENLNRFEGRLHDLELSRTIALQSVPQMKIIQTGNSVMAQKIQSAVLNTIPIWKNQYAAAVGLSQQTIVYKTQREIDKITNAMIQQNAENLRQTAVKAAAESRRGIDAEVLNKANESFVRAIEETLALNRDSTVQHRQAQIELGRIENQLQNTLLQGR
ncbi:MAG: toxic anion resistance protein [Oscillospiraceae bacterium]|nr:toxic anion resistance protein [Oscillospiraceae bacterium]